MYGLDPVWLAYNVYTIVVHTQRLQTNQEKENTDITYLPNHCIRWLVMFQPQPYDIMKTWQTNQEKRNSDITSLYLIIAVAVL